MEEKVKFKAKIDLFVFNSIDDNIFRDDKTSE